MICGSLFALGNYAEQMKSVMVPAFSDDLMRSLVNELDCGQALIVQDGSLGGGLGYSGESGVADGDREGLVALVDAGGVVVEAVVVGGDRDDGG